MKSASAKKRQPVLRQQPGLILVDLFNFLVG